MHDPCPPPTLDAEAVGSFEKEPKELKFYEMPETQRLKLEAQWAEFDKMRDAIYRSM